jgi:hypothetical protein
VIRPKLSLRRPLAVIGAAVVGLTAAVAVAAPASAHHSEIRVKADCDTSTGEWVVTWTVTSNAPTNVTHYRFAEVDGKKWVGDSVTKLDVPGIAVTDPNLPLENNQRYPHAADTPLEAQQRLSGDTTKASLTEKVQWENLYTDDAPRTAAISFSEACAKKDVPPPATAKPAANVTSDCDGNAIVKLQNAKEATAPAKFTITGSASFKQTATVQPDHDATVKVPAANAEHIKITVEGQREPIFDDAPAKAENCVTPSEPAGAVKMTCDELTFEVANPKDGKTVEVTFTPNKGEPQKLTVAPGETKTVSFKATEGLTVTPSGDGLDNPQPIAWEKPADCKSDKPSLPVTGPAAGAIAGGAALLLAAGVAMFLVARRRRLRFTA